MSHFCVLVLVPEKIKNIEDHVKKLMAPYSESLKVPEYEATCYCVGDAAKDEVKKAANEKFGTYDDIRKAFHEKNKVLSEKVNELQHAYYSLKEGTPRDERKKKADAFEEEEKKLDKLWKAAVAPRSAFEKEKFARHKDRKKASPTCGFWTEELLKSLREKHPEDKQYQKVKVGDRFDDGDGCGGTGKYLTKYNPKSKWDWYSIGGRWTGALVPSYDPAAEKENWEKCFLCQGGGLRNDDLGMKEREKDPAYTCNGCSGKGMHLKHSGYWKPFHGDVLPTKLIEKDFAPFAIVTPDGQWHEKGKMGWWAMVSDEDDTWAPKAQAIINDYRKTTTAVIVDCHI